MTISPLLIERLADVRAAIVTWPSAQTWMRCLLVYSAFAACALSVGFATGFLRPGLTELSPTMFALLPVYILLGPALLEELLFRALLLLRDATRVSPLRLALVSAAALSLFAAAHPLGAWHSAHLEPLHVAGIPGNSSAPGTGVHARLSDFEVSFATGLLRLERRRLDKRRAMPV